MNYYRAIVQYHGTNYFGFQWQKGIPTIQNDFNISLAKLVDGKFTTMSASRTDSGVHATDQLVKITSEQAIECSSFLPKLNQVLPPQIRCVGLTECPGSYQPTSGNFSKEYRYLFTNSLQSHGSNSHFITNNPYQLNIELMKKYALEIVGTHDFRNFCSAGSNVKTTIREVTFCELAEVNPHTVLPAFFVLPPDVRECYQLRIVGKGFLKQMVRHLMSALWLVGSGRMSQEDFLLLIQGGPKPTRLWKVASPRGLYLYKISYPNRPG